MHGGPSHIDSSFKGGLMNFETVKSVSAERRDERWVYVQYSITEFTDEVRGKY